MKMLETVPYKNNKSMQLTYDCAQAFYLHVRSMLNQVNYLSYENIDVEKIKYLDDEHDLVMQMLSLMRTNPTIGYESSNHYFYTQSNLFEKIINLSYLKQQ